MTADHPTREELYAAVIVAHQRIPMYDGSGGYRCVGCDHLRGEPDGPNSPRHAAHVAAALVAADPAPAQPDAALTERQVQDIAATIACLLAGRIDGQQAVQTTVAQVDRILAARAAQPVPAPEVWGDVLRVARTAVDSAYGTDPRHDLLARAVADAVAYGKPLPWSLSKHFGRDTPAPEVHLPGCQQFPTGWLCVAACTTVWKDNPAPEVSRGVAEAVLAVMPGECWVTRETGIRCTSMIGGTFPNGAEWTAEMCCLPCRVRDALPADDGADCCRERTTAGGCGCES